MLLSFQRPSRLAMEGIPPRALAGQPGGSIVDERTLRELYLRPFEMCVANSAPWMVMAAFNRLNGTPCSANPWLLSTVLTKEWGHRGVVVSDWFGVDDRVAALRAGLHLQMPHGPSAPAVVAAIEEGRLEQSVLDGLVRDLVALALKTDAARRPDGAFDATCSPSACPPGRS